MKKRVELVTTNDINEPPDSYQMLNNLLWLLWMLNVIDNKTYPSLNRKDDFIMRHGKS
jgi:hypothetical protein